VQIVYRLSPGEITFFITALDFGGCPAELPVKAGQLLHASCRFHLSLVISQNRPTSYQLNKFGTINFDARLQGSANGP
jgi:hypothetical protein